MTLLLFLAHDKYFWKVSYHKISKGKEGTAVAKLKEENESVTICWEKNGNTEVHVFNMA